MTDKELKHLSRSGLIDIIYELQKQNQQKDAACQELQDALKQREIVLSNAGSIAEAALQINRVMETAQAAADQYILSVEAANSRVERMLSEAETERARILQDANQEAASILEKARSESQVAWNNFQKKAGEMVQSYHELMTPTDKNR